MLRVATLQETAYYGGTLPRGLLPPMAGGGFGYYDAAILAGSPVVFWPENESSGTTATDSSGNSHNGTYAGGFTLAQAGIGDGESAVLWNGSTGQATATLASQPGVPYSLESWAFWTANQHGAIAKYGNISTGASGDGVAFGIGSGDMATTGGHLIVLYEGVAFHDTAITPALSTWHHIVLTVASGGVTVYLDGAGTAITGTAPRTPGTGTNLYSGGYTASDSTLRYFTGNTAKFALYNVALSAQQIANHYSAAKLALQTKPPWPQAMWRSAYR